MISQAVKDFINSFPDKRNAFALLRALDNYDRRTNRTFKQGAPAAKTTSTTLTAAELLGGLITGNQGAAGAATYTLPLATNIEIELAALGELKVDDAFEFVLINLSTVAAEIITVATNTGLTLVGDLTVAPLVAGDASQGRFIVRRTAADTYSVYRAG